MFGGSDSYGDNFFDSLCNIISQLGVSFLYLCLSFMVVAIGLYFIAKFRKTNKEIKKNKNIQLDAVKVQQEKIEV